MRLVQTMDPMLAPSLPVQIGISGSSACLQIDVISGARRNPQSNFESTAVFLGSDPECDFILDKEFFPPMYAFLLVDSQGTVVRHLGDGPSLLLDTKPTLRHRVTKTANITAGPLAIRLHVTPGAFSVDDPDSVRVQSPPNSNSNSATIAQNESGTDAIQIEKSIQLIEQASRLLASMKDQGTCVETSTGMLTDRRPSYSNDHNPAELNLSIGRPAAGQLPPLWHHLCLN
ncbi:MAG: hypothetical protein VX970_09745 [Planctomycetota bacterium]|nr:hypothetical protein [Planctomycetota bacterium]